MYVATAVSPPRWNGFGGLQGQHWAEVNDYSIIGVRTGICNASPYGTDA